MKMSYKPSGVCVKEIKLEVEDNILKTVEFVGGCPGNLALLKKLIEGKNVDDTINEIDGVRCGEKQTSCSMQLCNALRMIKR